MSLLCAVRMAFYTVRYWLNGGIFGFVVSGHEFGSPSYRMGTYDGISVEWEDLTCEKCGALDSAWTRVGA